MYKIPLQVLLASCVCVAKKDLRDHFNYVKIQDGYVTATDGHRLLLCDIDGLDKSFDLFIHPDHIKELSKGMINSARFGDVTTYMMGFEESFGYLIKPFVRDKDAIQAVLVVAELAAYYRSRGLTLADGIEEIYKEYGYYAEKTISVTLSGVDGAEQIKAIMAKFRDNGPKEFNATTITVVEDFKAQTSTAADGTVTALTTPPSDVLKYTLTDGSWIAVRPSGTEPKIKFYIAVVGESNEDSQAKIANIEAEINAFVK